MLTAQVKILSITVHVAFSTAYAFAHHPENFPKWAAGLSKSLHKTAKGWEADTPQGKAYVRFSDENPYGVLDHWVSFPGKPDIHIPLRMIPNGQGTEVELVLFRQPDMTDAQFAHDAELVMADLKALKRLLEGGK